MVPSGLSLELGELREGLAVELSELLDLDGPLLRGGPSGFDVPVDGAPSDGRADDGPSSAAATSTPADQRETPGVPGEGTRP